MMYLIGIDPSINSTGFCILKNDPQEPNEKFRFEIIYNQRITSNKSDDLRLKVIGLALGITTLMNQLDKWCDEGYKRYIMLELPQYFATKHGAAEGGSQSFMKLTLAAGTILGSCLTSERITDIKLITANQWKGQVPKHIIKTRLDKVFPGIRKWSHDEVDALGIAYYGIKYLASGGSSK